jgi:hypothetical protein
MSDGVIMLQFLHKWQKIHTRHLRFGLLAAGAMRRELSQWFRELAKKSLSK